MTLFSYIILFIFSFTVTLNVLNVSYKFSCHKCLFWFLFFCCEDHFYRWRSGIWSMKLHVCSKGDFLTELHQSTDWCPFIPRYRASSSSSDLSGSHAAFLWTVSHRLGVGVVGPEVEGHGTDDPQLRRHLLHPPEPPLLLRICELHHQAGRGALRTRGQSKPPRLFTAELQIWIWEVQVFIQSLCGCKNANLWLFRTGLPNFFLWGAHDCFLLWWGAGSVWGLTEKGQRSQPESHSWTGFK